MELGNKWCRPSPSLMCISIPSLTFKFLQYIIVKVGRRRKGQAGQAGQNGQTAERTDTDRQQTGKTDQTAQTDETRWTDGQTGDGQTDKQTDRKPAS